MTDTTPEAAFAAALAKFQAELPTVTKDATGQVGNQRTRYADLASIVEAAYPKLAANGLSYIAAPTLEDGAFVLRYALMHEGGHREGGLYPLPASATSQQIGSALTYARRYCLLAVTGLAPKDDDDDGTKGSEVQTTVLPRAPRRPNATTRHTAESLGDPATRPDEFASEPERVTDTAWIEDFRQRLVLCSSAAEVRGLQAEANAQWTARKISPDDAGPLKAEVEARLSELVPA